MTVKQQEIAKDIVKLQLQQVINLKQSVTRNVIFVGKARCGKSTIFEVLKNPSFVTKQLSIFRGTVEPKLQSFTVERKYKNKEEMNDALKRVMNRRELQGIQQSENEDTIGDEEYDEFRKKVVESIEEAKREMQIKNDSNAGIYSINFNINIIDTPGLFEATKGQKLTRDNKTIRDTILQCMRKEIKKIHAIFFVCSFTAGLNSQELQAFNEFLTLFKGVENNIALIITRSESITVKNQKNIKKQIMEDQDLKKILDKIGEKRIFFMGAIDHNTVDEKLTDRVKLSLDNVRKMRDELFEYIFDINQPCHINQIGFIQDKGEEVVKLQKQLIKLLKKKKEGEDVNTLEINKLRKEIQEYSGFIVSKKGETNQQEIEQLLTAIDKLVLKKQIEFSNYLKNEEKKDKGKLEEMFTQIENDKEFIMSTAGTHFYNKNKKALKEYLKNTN